MRNKILLLNPIAEDEKSFIRIGRCQTQAQPGIECWPPVDLALIAAALKDSDQDMQIHLYDAQIEKNYESMLEFIFHFKPDIIILNCTTPTCFSDIDLVKKIKNFNDDILVIFFGLHATARPLELMESKLIDCCILGEPEEAVCSLVRHYKDIRNKDFKQINNIFYLSDENIIVKTDQKERYNQAFLNLYPDRSLLNNQFYRLQYDNEPFTIIQTSRGCPNHCIYCTANQYASRYTSRSVESVISEIEEIITEYKIKNIMFLSDTFTAHRKWIEKLCKMLIDKKIHIKWMANSRADKIDLTLARLMKEAGCWLVSLGIESLDENILRNVEKKINRQEIDNAVRDLHLAKIQTIGYFMFGLPGESEETIRHTIRNIKYLQLDYAYFFHATPFPGTKLYELAQRNNWLVTDDWNQYAHGKNILLRYTGLTSRQLEKAVRNAYRIFYFRPKQIIKHIPSVWSWKVIRNYIRIAVTLFYK